MKRTPRLRHGFTLIEMLTVMMVISILAALVVAAARPASDQARRKRAEGEIQGFSTGLEAYKTDNGDYPRSLPNSDSNDADQVDPRSSNSNPAAMVAAAKVLYVALSGDTNLDQNPTNTSKVYFEFRPKMLHLTSKSVDSVVDPWGTVYGYSTACHADMAAGNTNNPRGYNPTFDLWSTANSTKANTQSAWVKNW